MRTARSAGVSLLAMLSLAVGASGCKTSAANSGSQFKEAEVSDACKAVAPVGDPLTWLNQKENQTELSQIFNCAQMVDTSRVPLGTGKGYGSLYAKWEVWNTLQKKIGDYLWGGKIFTKDGDKTTLINIMKDNGSQRYRANVYVGTSIVDGQNSVILDYRIDDTVASGSPAGTPAQEIVDKIVHGIRDEIREVYQDGQPTNVFIGRAYIYRKALHPISGLTGSWFPISDEQFSTAGNWFFAANFFLDFRDSADQTTDQGDQAESAASTGACYFVCDNGVKLCAEGPKDQCTGQYVASLFEDQGLPFPRCLGTTLFRPGHCQK